MFAFDSFVCRRRESSSSSLCLAALPSPFLPTVYSACKQAFGSPPPESAPTAAALLSAPAHGGSPPGRPARRLMLGWLSACARRPRPPCQSAFKLKQIRLRRCMRAAAVRDDWGLSPISRTPPQSRSPHTSKRLPPVSFLVRPCPGRQPLKLMIPVKRGGSAVQAPQKPNWPERRRFGPTPGASNPQNPRLWTADAVHRGLCGRA